MRRDIVTRYRESLLAYFLPLGTPGTWQTWINWVMLSASLFSFDACIFILIFDQALWTTVSDPLARNGGVCVSAAITHLSHHFICVSSLTSVSMGTASSDLKLHRSGNL